MVGAVTFLLAEVCTLLSCVMGIKPGTLGITLIAVGTQLPEAVASFKAARHSEHAEAAIGNLLGVNTATVLLGMGLPWVIAVNYLKDTKQDFTLPARGMLLTIALYMITSFFGMLLLAARSFRSILGGSANYVSYLSAAFLVALWAIFIVLASLNHYALEAFGEFRSIFNGD